MSDNPIVPLVCGHISQALPIDHPDPYVCQARRAGMLVVTVDDGRPPMHTCGHLIGAGIHRSQEEVDTCAAAGRARAEEIHRSFAASLQPGWRGAKLLVSVTGTGDERVGKIEIVPFGPGYITHPSPTSWTVELSTAYKPGSQPWAVVRVESETPMRAQVTQHDSFTLALHAAMIDASTDLTIRLE